MAPLQVISSYLPHDATLRGVLASRASADGDRTFLICEDREWSWTRFAEAVDATAAMLVGRGVGRGDRIAIMAANSDAFVALVFAIARAGAIAVPVNPSFGVEEARYVVEHAGACAVAATAETLDVATRACARLDPAPWRMLVGAGDGSVPGVDELVASTPAGAPPDDVGPDDPFLIMYTSGTTGFPKGAMHAQRSFVLAGEGFVERMHLQPDDRLLCILPLFHINALFYSLGGAVAAGASLVVAPRFSASRFWRLAARTGATEVNVIAAVGAILARRPREEFVPEHRIAKVYGAPVSPEMDAVFRGEFGVATVLEGYGMTEIPGACNQPFEGPHRLGAMGRAARHPDPAVRFAELRVVDDAGRDVPDGVEGELLVRTPIVMRGYWRDPEQTAAAFRDGDWFATGDVVRRDADGFVWFVARAKDIIRRRGENVSGAEIDRVVDSHPDVAEAAAIAVPSELGEDDILVAVVPADGAAPIAAEIAEWCAARLAPAKVPRYVVFVEELPHTPTHRVAKFRLRGDPGLMATAVDLEAR